MMGRQLGKLCHAHPAIVFDYILDQVTVCVFLQSRRIKMIPADCTEYCLL